MASKSKNQQMGMSNYLVVVVLVSLLVLGVTAVLGNSLVRGIILDTKVISAKGAANVQLDSDITAAPQLVSAYQSLGATQQLILDALPTTSDLPGLMALLENLSGSAGVTLKSISPSQANATTVIGANGPTNGTVSNSRGGSGSVVPPASQPLEVDLSFTGTYSALLQLLTGLERSSRPMHVNSIQLTGSGSGLNITVDLTTYYQDAAQLPFSTKVVK